MTKISAVISAYNEEDKIKDCLSSVDWVDEVILVDNSSTDNTAKIAQKMGAKVFKRKNYKMLNINKNLGFSKAKNKYVLNLDADERVTPALKKEINNLIKAEKLNKDGYLIPRKNIIFGKWIKHSLWWPDYQLRLFKKDKGRFAEEHVHEKIVISGKIKKLKNPILHYNYQTISQFIQKMDNIYTENEAGILAKKDLKWTDAIKRPASDFVKTYFSQRGYKDGIHGLVLSVLQSFYSFVVFAKAWEKKEFIDLEVKNPLKNVEKQFENFSKERKYWIYEQKINETRNYIVKIFLKIKRKLLLL